MSSSPPDPWRQPQDPDASSPDWGRPARPSGAPPAPGPFGEPAPSEPPNYLQQGGDWWTPRQGEQGPRTSGWDAQTGGWGQPPGQEGWPPPGPPTGEQQPYPGDPYGPPTGQYPPGQYPPDPYGQPPDPYGRPPDPYGRPPGPYGQPPGPYGQPPGPYGPDPYGQQQPPMDDPYGMWGAEQAWEDQDPSQVGPSRRRRKWPLAVLGAVTVIIAIVVFVPGVRNLLGGGGSAQAAALGEPVADGNAEFTVVDVDCGQTELDGSNIVAQDIFCVLHLRTTNNGDTPLLIDAQAQQVFDQNDQQLPVNQQWLAAPNRSYAAQVPPGQSVDGVVIYDAPTGTVPSRTVLHSTPDSPGVTVEVTQG